MLGPAGVDESKRRVEKDILVGANTGCFEGFRRKLLVFVGDHVDAEGEFVDIGTLAPQIENSDFRVRDTTVESRLGIWL